MLKPGWIPNFLNIFYLALVTLNHGSWTRPHQWIKSWTSFCEWRGISVLLLENGWLQTRTCKLGDISKNISERTTCRCCEMNERQLAFRVFVLNRSAMLRRHRTDSSSIWDLSVVSQMSCKVFEEQRVLVLEMEPLSPTDLQHIDGIAVGQQHQFANVFGSNRFIHRRSIQVQQHSAKYHRRCVMNFDFSAKKFINDPPTCQPSVNQRTC